LAIPGIPTVSCAAGVEVPVEEGVAVLLPFFATKRWPWERKWEAAAAWPVAASVEEGAMAS